jgi:hypothetical protein
MICIIAYFSALRNLAQRLAAGRTETMTAKVRWQAS